MTGRPLRPVTDHRLGRLLPYQLANRTKASPRATPLRAPFFFRIYAVLAKVSLGYPPLKGRFLRFTHPSAARRQVVLLLLALPLDLHVLGVPPAFNLSQDQTLHLLKLIRFRLNLSRLSCILLLTNSGKRALHSLFYLLKNQSRDRAFYPIPLPCQQMNTTFLN